MTTSIFDKMRPSHLKSRIREHQTELLASRLQAFSFPSRNASSSLKFVVKIPDNKYSDLGVRLYGPHTIHVRDLESIPLELAKLGVDPRFKRFYFNTLSLEGTFDPECHTGLRCVEKVERVLSLTEVKETSIYRATVAGYRIERYHCSIAAKSAELLQLNRAFHNSKSLDSAWMEKQYIRSPGDHHQILTFIARSPDEEIVGFADVILSEPNEEAAMQRNTFVSVEHRNLGLGTSLKGGLVNSIANSTSKQWVIAHNEAENVQMTHISDNLGFRTIQKYKRIEGDL